MGDRILERHIEIERSIIKKFRKNIWNNFVGSVQEYELISEGDKIAVCISGGKDSVLMALCLRQLQRYSNVPFSLVYLVMDPGYNPENRKLIEENCKLLNIDATIFESDIFEVADRAGGAPCYLCARMRRGCLYSKAKELGCTNSNFITPNGIHDDYHYTSAHDMALIAQAFFSNELLCKMSLTTSYHVPQTATQPREDMIVWAKSKLLPGKEYAYDSLVGTKTGYTDDARQTLVSCAQKNGLKLVCVIFFK